MAKRRRAKTRIVYKTRTVRARARPAFMKRRRRNSKGMNSELKIAIGGFGYGAIRQPLNNIAQMIPFVAGAFGDEVGLGVLSYLLARGKIPILNKLKVTRDIGRAGLAIESASLGQQLMGGQMSNLLGFGRNTTTTSNGIR